MMKKLIAALLTAVLLLTCSALADTYNEYGITFTYDANVLQIVEEDHTDGEDTVVVGFKDAAWGKGYIRIYLSDLEDGETFPTKEDFAELEAGLNTEVTQGEWAGFTDVFMYSTDDDGVYELTCIVPIYDDDGKEVDDLLTVNIAVSGIEDEDVAMARDDAISEVVDTLAVIDD